VQEGLQGDVLVDPARRPGADAAELVRHALAPVLQVADGDLERVERHEVHVSVEKIRVREPVVRDRVAVTADHEPGGRLKLP